MFEWLAALNGLETFFVMTSIVGGIPMIIIFTIQLFSGADFDSSVPDGDLDVSDFGDSPDISFKFLSFMGLSTFLTMFGLVGLALYRTSKVPAWGAITGGVLGGVISVWVIAKIYSIFGKLQSSGTLDIKEAIGNEGEVYLTIKENQSGRVNVTVNNRLREYEAISSDGGELPTGTRICVDSVSGNRLEVKKIGN